MRFSECVFGAVMIRCDVAEQETCRANAVVLHEDDGDRRRGFWRAAHSLSTS